MKHADLQRAVAQATGEGVRLIKAMGFREASVPTEPIRRRRKRRRRRRGECPGGRFHKCCGKSLRQNLPTNVPTTAVTQETQRMQLSRLLVRQFRAIVRKATPVGDGKALWSPVAFASGKEGTSLHVQSSDVAVTYHQPGAAAEERFSLPLEALAQFEGNKDDVVLLKKVKSGVVQATWTDNGVPQLREFSVEARSKTQPAPEPPVKFTNVDRRFLQAMHDAAYTVGRDHSRFAVMRIQLGGQAGEVAATDGHQVLVHSGLTLPWKEELLVPAIGAFGSRELPDDAKVEVGKTATHVGVRAGPWTFLLRIDAIGRFPPVHEVFPKLPGNHTIVQFDPVDASFLLKTLPRLPGREEPESPVTLDLHGPVVLRAKAQGHDRVTEAVLTASRVSGPAPKLRIQTNRRYLARALELGFDEMHLVGANSVITCRDDQRRYGWMPLSPEGALPTSTDAVQIVSQQEPVTIKPPTRERSTTVMSNTSTTNAENGHERESRAREGRAASNGTAPANELTMESVIADAQGLRDALRETYERTGRLIAALKHFGKQSRLVQSTLHSLRQLQNIGR
jgi:hypothetical protein